MFRAHYDSHLFTFVFPITIPKRVNNCDNGQLIFFPKNRPQPSNEFMNAYTKILHKKYASKEGVDGLCKRKEYIIDDFSSMEPILFLGNTTLHTNYPVGKDANSHRLTLLSHLFDPSPSFSIGSLMRKLRNR